jgi:hypothetical protein
VDAESAFGDAVDGVWQSCPVFYEKSGEFIAYEWARPVQCRVITLQLPPAAGESEISFFVEASDDDFDRDIRQLHQITARADGARRQFDLSDFNVFARSWRLMRRIRSLEEATSIAYLRFGPDNGAPRDLAAIARKAERVEGQFPYQRT